MVLVQVLASIVVRLPGFSGTKFEFSPSNALPKYFLTIALASKHPTRPLFTPFCDFITLSHENNGLPRKGLSLEALGGFYHTELNSFGSVGNLSRKLQAVRVFQFFDMLPSLGLLLIPLMRRVAKLSVHQSRRRRERSGFVCKTDKPFHTFAKPLRFHIISVTAKFKASDGFAARGCRTSILSILVKRASTTHR
jgi:hypothetical protein